MKRDRGRILDLKPHGADRFDTQYTVLGEWTDDAHLNLGSGPQPQPDAFLSALRLVLSDQPGP